MLSDWWKNSVSTSEIPRHCTTSYLVGHYLAKLASPECLLGLEGQVHTLDCALSTSCSRGWLHIGLSEARKTLWLLHRISTQISFGQYFSAFFVSPTLLSPLHLVLNKKEKQSSCLKRNTSLPLQVDTLWMVPLHSDSAQDTGSHSLESMFQELSMKSSGTQPWKILTTVKLQLNL